MVPSPDRILCIVIGIASTAVAHDGLDERIADVTKQIESTPDEPALYLKRAEYHRQHQDPDNALADIEVAARLDPEWEEVHLARARAYFVAEMPRASAAAATRYLVERDNIVDAWVIRARAHVALDRGRAAADDFSKAIEHSSGTRPELFVERARALMSIDPPENAEALAGLERAIAAYGPLIYFESCAIDAEVALGRYDDAIQRIDRIAAPMARPERWMVKRAEVLEAAGRYREAWGEYAAVLDTLAELPDSKLTESVLEYRRTLIEGIERCERALSKNGDEEERREVGTWNDAAP